jgi:hypothetical protein
MAHLTAAQCNSWRDRVRKSRRSAPGVLVLRNPPVLPHRNRTPNRVIRRCTPMSVDFSGVASAMASAASGSTHRRRGHRPGWAALTPTELSVVEQLTIAYREHSGDGQPAEPPTKRLTSASCSTVARNEGQLQRAAARGH